MTSKNQLIAPKYSIPRLAALLALGSITLIGSGCGGGGSSGGSANLADSNATYTQYTNPNDSHLYSADMQSGAKVLVYGTKSPQGDVQTVDAVRYQAEDDASTGEATWLHFDNLGKLGHFVGDSGAVFTIEKVNDSVYSVAVVNDVGDIQVNTTVNIDSQGQPSTLSMSAHAEPGKEARDDGFELELMPVSDDQDDIEIVDIVEVVDEFDDNSNEESPSDSNDTQTAGGYIASQGVARVEASVFECSNGQAVENAEVYFSASHPGDPLPPTYLAPHQGRGTYAARIPLGNAPLTGDAARNACNSIALAASVTCESTFDMRLAGHNQFCLALASGLDVLAVGPTGEGALIFAQCEAGFAAMDAYCNTLSPTPTGLPGSVGPTDYLCDAIANYVDIDPGIQSAVSQNQLEVQGYVKIPGRETIKTQAQTFNPFSQQYPVFEVDRGGAIAIDNVSVSPAAPKKGQGYSVTTQLSCSQDAVLNIEVTGSDGSKTTHELFPEDDKPLTVSVAGSVSSRDVIRVLAVSSETGPFGYITATRNVVVAFSEATDGASPVILPEVSVAASDSSASEDGDQGKFTLTRTGDTGSPLTIQFALSGNATAGSDYEAIATSSIIPVGSSSVDIVINVLSDSETEETESVILTLLQTANYTLSTTYSSSISIIDVVAKKTEPNWENDCVNDNSLNTGGALAHWSMGDDPPYNGRGIICSDKDFDFWLDHNSVGGPTYLLVDDIRMGEAHPGLDGCFVQPRVTLASGTVIGGGWICPLL